MSDDVVRLVRPAVEVNPQMVAELETLLQRVKSGEIGALAVAIEDAKGGCESLIVASPGIGVFRWDSLIVAIEILRVRLLRHATRDMADKPFG